MSKQPRAQSAYNLVIEPQLSMSLGAENISSIHYLWRSLDNHYIPTKIFKKKTVGSKIANVAYRFSKLFLVEYPITFVLPTIQHELFGHGTRVLEFGMDIESIRITLPPPFQLELPGISYTWNTGLSFTDEQDMMISTSGSEANNVLANLLRKNILLDGELDYHNAFLYLYANNDLNGYASFAPHLSDIDQYLHRINGHYSHNRLTEERLILYGYIGLLSDPINYLAFYSIFKSYLWDGETSGPLYAIPIVKEVSLLPKFRFLLSPYGPELILQNYVRYRQKLFCLSISHTDNTFASAWRIKLEGWNWQINNNFTLNASAEIWQQPSINFYVGQGLYESKGIGGAFVINSQYDFLNKGHKLGLTLQVGYKTMGFMEGEMLQAGLIARGGLFFRFDNKKKSEQTQRMN